MPRKSVPSPVTPKTPPVSKVRGVVTDLLIGVDVTVELLSNPRVRVNGCVVDETRSTLVLAVGSPPVQKRFPKRTIVLERWYHGCQVRVSGSLLYGRPEERLKSEVRKVW